MRLRSVGDRWLLCVLVALSFVPPVFVGLVWLGVVTEAHVRIERPIASLIAPIASMIVASRLWSRAGAKSRLRASLTDLLVGTTALALSLSVMGVELGRALDKLTVILVVDRSRSIDLVPEAEALEIRQAIVASQAMRPDDRIGTVVFGATATTEDPPHTKREGSTGQRAEVGRDGTDLDRAIRRALAEVPADSAARIVIMSDGVATRGDTMAAAAAARAARVPIDVVPLDQRNVPDVRVVAVRAPTRGAEGEAIDLRVVTSAPRETEVVVTVKRDGQVISRDKTTILEGEDVHRIREKLEESGLHRYDVEVSPTDPSIDFSSEDNSGTAFVRVRGEASALVLEGDPGRGAFIAGALRKASFRVDEGDVTRVPTDLGGFAAYDLVVLSDIAAPKLAEGQIAALASYVRDLGGGLLLLGGDRSLGPGGYGKTPIEEISPVSFDIKQEERRASLAEVIGIDISGSMAMEVGGRTKLDLANEAAARSAALLGPGDLLGVEHVDTEVHWSVPLGPIVDKNAIEHAIRAVEVGGGGIIVPITLEAGYAALDGKAGSRKVNLKHLLLFADGDDAEEIHAALPLAAPALGRGITTSVVALGMGKDTADLEQLSKLGGGRFYLIEDAARLPSVFAQETILAARASIVEKSFRPARGASADATAGIDFTEAPPLLGYVVTMPKGRASVLLTGPEGDPILATWPAGIGRSGVFTSDLKDRWGTAWTDWPGAARMVAQTARDLSRKAGDARVRLESDASSGELHLRATVIGDDGRADAFRRLTVRVSGPSGIATDVPLEATGAGAYSADLPLSLQGTYISVVKDDETGAALATTGAVLSRGEELRPTGSDRALLEKIAKLTGGKTRDTLERIFLDRVSARVGYSDETRSFVLVGAFGLFLVVAVRRLTLPPVLGPLRRRIEARLARQRAARVPTAQTVRAESTMQALLAARGAARGAEVVPTAARAPATSPSAKSSTEPPVTRDPQAKNDAASSPSSTGPTHRDPMERDEARAPTKSHDRPPEAEPRSPGAPKLTTAEILLAKKRRR